jgi:hypothetical protein
MVEDTEWETDGEGGGYRKPPRAACFRKGSSGNPAGRPKGTVGRKHRPRSERLNSLMLEEAYRPVTVSEDGKEVTMPVAQAVFRSLVAAATRGEARAQAMFLKMVNASEVEEAAMEEMRGESAVEEKRKIVYRIVDAANGRPTGRTRLINRDGSPFRGDSPGAEADKDR